MRGIYELKFSNGMCYIDLSSQLGSRFAQHLRSMEKGQHHNKRVQECYDKLGPPQFSILEKGEYQQDELHQKEQEYIKKYRYNGVNLLNILKSNRTLPPIEAMQEASAFNDKVRSLVLLKKIQDQEENILELEIQLYSAIRKRDQLLDIREVLCVVLQEEEMVAVHELSIKAGNCRLFCVCSTIILISALCRFYHKWKSLSSVKSCF